MVLEHLLNDFLGHSRRFIGRLRFEQREFGVVFAEVRPEAAFVGFLISVAVIAHQNADFSRSSAHLVKCPRRGASDFEVIQSDISHARVGSQGCDQPEYGDA